MILTSRWKTNRSEPHENLKVYNISYKIRNRNHDFYKK